MAKMVKLADRLHNLSETHLTSKSFQKKYIEETEKYYLKLAKDTIFEDKIREELLNLKNIIKD
jgi:(p)ppGpp synthase/HD superfamily hydrolase